MKHLSFEQNLYYESIFDEYNRVDHIHAINLHDNDPFKIMINDSNTFGKQEFVSKHYAKAIHISDKIPNGCNPLNLDEHCMNVNEEVLVLFPYQATYFSRIRM